MKPRKPWPTQQMIEWYQSGMTLQEIADALSSDEWQPYWRIHSGNEYRPHQKMVNKHLKSRIKLRARGAPGERNGSWKGGRRIDEQGYILVYMPDHPFAAANGCVREHRLIVEAAIGRYLTESEIVHHRDDDPSNNAIDNLLLYESNAAHIRDTRQGKQSQGQIEGLQRAVSVRFRGAKLSDWWPDDLLRKWYESDHLSLRQIADLLGRDSRTIRSQLTRIGIHGKHTKAGIVTDSIRAECLQFLSSPRQSTPDDQE